MTNHEDESALEKAQRVSEDREAKYGSPLPNMQKIANMWGAYLGVEITPADAAIMMQQLKQARLKTGEPSKDEVADVAGYVNVLDRVLEDTDAYPGFTDYSPDDASDRSLDVDEIGESTWSDSKEGDK